MNVALEAAPDTPRDELVIESRSPFQGAKVGQPVAGACRRVAARSFGRRAWSSSTSPTARRRKALASSAATSCSRSTTPRSPRPAISSASPASRAGAWRITIVRGGQQMSVEFRRMTPRARQARRRQACSLPQGSSAMRRARSPTSCARAARRGRRPGSSARIRTARSRACSTPGTLGSLIFWGPPGTGKTTVARLLAQATDLHFEQISAIFSGVADLKKVFDAARARRETGQGTLLFVDEIHRFNRAQQDSFLPVMEDGTIVLVGATTENPSFELIAPLLSRARVLVFKSLDAAAIEKLLARAEAIEGKAAAARSRRRAHRLIRMADGDGRAALTLAEEVWRAARAGRGLRRRETAGGGAAPRADLRQEAGRPLQPDQRPAQIGARLRSRCRALLSLPHARCRRGPALSRAAGRAHGGRGYRAWPIRRRW